MPTEVARFSPPASSRRRPTPGAKRPG